MQINGGYITFPKDLSNQEAFREQLSLLLRDYNYELQWSGQDEALIYNMGFVSTINYPSGEDK